MDKIDEANKIEIIDRADEIEQLKSDLLNTMSHKLRSPLASIKGYTTTLLRFDKRLRRHEQREFLEAIRDATDILSATVDRLLEMAQFEVQNSERVYLMPARKTTILTADDDPQLLRLMTRTLQLEGYEVVSASDGQEALSLIESKVPDAVLLDVMMPRMDGFTVCQRVREFSLVPIIIVTARGQDQDKIRGLDLGADDYLTKPFSVDELLARVRAVLRRSQFSLQGSPQAASPTMTIGNITIDFSQHLVTRDGKEVVITPTEYRILSYLAQNAGRVVTQDLLLEHVWGSEYIGESHMLQVNMNRLRRKIEVDPTHPHFILTKVGIGYYMPAQANS